MERRVHRIQHAKEAAFAFQSCEVLLRISEQIIQEAEHSVASQPDKQLRLRKAGAIQFIIQEQFANIVRSDEWFLLN